MVSTKTSAVVWGRGAGRCYYPGCNKSLIGDLISGNEDANFGFVAHIVGEKATGPRGDTVHSPLLEDDPANLMLLCGPHHKLIDVDEREEHTVQRLQDIKAAHEDRVRIVTEIAPDRASHVLRYGAKVGSHESPVSFQRVRTAMLPERYPADGRSIGIEIKGSLLEDGEQAFWSAEPDNLRRMFDRDVRARIAEREITHLSVFALGPIPLLVQLGHLLGDITQADVYQLHREPAGWFWAKNGPRIEYQVARPGTVGPVVALKLALSATINDERITSILGEGVSIWALTAAAPGNDVMRHLEDLMEFRRLMRSLYDEIKAAHGQDAVIHVFPAVPVSVAVEIGRTLMPKADLPLLVYDETRGQGFVPRLQIG